MFGARGLEKKGIESLIHLIYPSKHVTNLHSLNRKNVLFIFSNERNSGLCNSYRNNFIMIHRAKMNSIVFLRESKYSSFLGSTRSYRNSYNFIISVRPSQPITIYHFVLKFYRHMLLIFAVLHMQRSRNILRQHPRHLRCC